MTKVGHIRGFLEKGMKVKSSLFFRGRENAHRELGFAVMQRVLKECEDLCQVDLAPKLMGNSIVMVIGPRPGGKVVRHDPPPVAPSRPDVGPAVAIPRPVAQPAPNDGVPPA